MAQHVVTEAPRGSQASAVLVSVPQMCCPFEPPGMRRARCSIMRGFLHRPPSCGPTHVVSAVLVIFYFHADTGTCQPFGTQGHVCRSLCRRGVNPPTVLCREPGGVCAASGDVAGQHPHHPQLWDPHTPRHSDTWGMSRRRGCVSAAGGRAAACLCPYPPLSRLEGVKGTPTPAGRRFKELHPR